MHKKGHDCVGRPSPYDQEQHPRLARELTGDGATLADLAQVFGVARSTVQDWQVEHTEFGVAIRLGREDATDKVEKALFKRATGYQHKIEKLIVVSQGPIGSEVQRHETTEAFPPDTKAAELWLHNMRADRWKKNPVPVQTDAVERVVIYTPDNGRGQAP